MAHEDYNYESENSLAIMSQICAFLLGRPLHGGTQHEIADMLKMSMPTASRYINHLLHLQRVHIAMPIKATSRGHLPAVYKHGPVVYPYIKPGTKYRDLPLTFFRKKTNK